METGGLLLILEMIVQIRKIKAKVQMGILKPAHEVFEAIVDPGN